MEASSRPLAVVTGASSGIGLELAKLFAAANFDLVVAAEDDRIHTIGGGISSAGVTAQAVQVDLATVAGVEGLYARLPRTPDALALNAGIGAGGAFATDTRLADELNLVDLNVPPGGAGHREAPAVAQRRPDSLTASPSKSSSS